MPGAFLRYARRMRPLVLSFVGLVSLLTGPGSARAVLLGDVTEVGLPVSLPPGLKPNGLCAKYRLTDRPLQTFLEDNNPNTSFDARQTIHNNMAGFLNETSGVIERLLTSPMPIDLFNHVQEGDFKYGEFTVMNPDPARGCNSIGCRFFFDLENGVPKVGTGDQTKTNPTTYSGFGTRLRGFLNVPAEWLNQPVNFALFADDGASLVLWDKGNAENRHYANLRHIVISSGRAGGRRDQIVSTNRVFFKSPGLYPIELVHAQAGVVAILEWSVKVGDHRFPDGRNKQEWPPGLMDVRLNPGGENMPPPRFEILDAGRFYQTTTGDSPFDEGKCQQCNRDFAGRAGAGPTVGCDRMDHFCNEAALCAPCTDDSHCGTSCAPCNPNEICKDKAGSGKAADFACVPCGGDNPDRCRTPTSCTSDGECRIDECCNGAVCIPASEELQCRSAHGGALCCSTTAPAAPAAPRRAPLVGLTSLVMLCVSLGLVAAARRRPRKN